MKKSLFTLLMMAFAVFNGFAQDDDVYFVPTKKAQKSNVASQNRNVSSSYEVISSADDDENWYVGRTSGRDIDEYNRRGSVQDDENNKVIVEETYNNDDVEYVADGTYTARIIRFHSPGAVIIASPWYWDYYNTYFYDPWYGYSWRGYYALNTWGWSWNWGWSRPYYGWNYGWYRPYYSWYDPWRYNYGWHRPYHHHGYSNSWAWRPRHHGPAYTDYRRGWGSGRDLGRGNRNHNIGLGNGRDNGRYGKSSNGNGGRFGGNNGTRTIEPGQRGRLGNSSIGNGSHSLGSRPTVNRHSTDYPVREVRPSNNNETRTERTGVTGGSNRGRTFGSGSSNSGSGRGLSNESQTRSSSSNVTPSRSNSSSVSRDVKPSNSGRSLGTSSSGSSSGRGFGSSSGSSSGRSFGSGSSSSGGGRSFGGGGHSSGSSGGGRGFGGRR